MTLLRRGTRQSPSFAAEDLLAVAIVRVLTADFAIRTGTISAIAAVLLETCNVASWPMLKRGKQIVDLANGRLQFQPEFEDAVVETLMLIIPWKPVIEYPRDALLTDGRLDTQEPLRFPPTSLSSKVGAVSTGGRP